METAFNNLVKDVIAAGEYAAAQQHKVSRGIKKDGSILTKTDTELDKLITEKINKHFPNSIIISEENPEPVQKTNKTEWIFTIDPIDGTDSYSQGMPGWCVAVGLLNSDYEPAGGIIYAPRWGMTENKGNLITRMPGGPVMVNGKEIDISEFDFDTIGQIMIGSGLHKVFYYSTYGNKVRVAGSAVINIIAALIHSDVKGSIITPCYIWDIAPAHGIIIKAGLNLEYYSGKKVDYRFLAERNKAPESFVSGSSGTLELIRKHFKLK